MGCVCGGNVKDATPDEQQELFTWAVKETQIICAGRFLSTEQSINIELPKDQTDRVSAEVDEVEKGEGAEKKGGMFGQMMGKAQNALKQGAEQVKQGQIVDAAQNALKQGAEQVKRSVGQCKQGIEKHLQDKRDAAIGDVQVKLLNNSNPELLAKFAEVIKNGTAQDPRALVRGESPYGEDQYKNCRSDAIMNDLYIQNKEDLKAILMKHCDLDANASVKAWSQLLEGVGKANELLGRNKFSINFNIKDHIVDKTLLHMVTKMGEFEKDLRSNPVGKANEHKETFELCFSGNPLKNIHYNKFRDECKNTR